MVLVGPLVFRAPHVLSCGLGCFMCPWAAARPRVVRAASFARRVVSKPGQAPPPPTGTAAGPSGALHTSGTLCAGVCLYVGSKPGQAPPPPTGTAVDPSGALHTGGAWCADVGSLSGQALPPPTGIGSLSRETGVAFALSYVSGIETAIAFAGEKRAIMMQLLGAEVLSVSTVAVQG